VASDSLWHLLFVRGRRNWNLSGYDPLKRSSVQFLPKWTSCNQQHFLGALLHHAIALTTSDIGRFLLLLYFSCERPERAYRDGRGSVCLVGKDAPAIFAS